MRLIPNLLGNDWNKQIDGLVGGRKPLTTSDEYNPDFPWAAVQECTTRHIISKKGRPAPGFCDERLMKLIQRSERKDVAFAACIHLLSPPAVRTLLVGDFAGLEAILYLQLIRIGQFGCPAAVEELESGRARVILWAFRLHRAKSDAEYPKAIFHCIRQGIPKTSLVYSVFHAAAVAAVAELSTELATLRQSYKWHEAWQLISWMYMIPEAPKVPVNHLDPIELLDVYFSAWRMWLAWKPLQATMYTPGQALSGVHMNALREYLMLEGPDDSPNPKANRCERLRASKIYIKAKVAEIGTMRLKLEEGTQDEAAEMLSRLLDCISRILRTGGTQYLANLLFLLVGKVISADSLDILETLLTTTEWELSLLVDSIYQSVKSGRNLLLNAKYGLPLLRNSGYEKLKMTSFGKLVVDVLMQEIRGLQDKLRTIWESVEVEYHTSTEETTMLELHAAVARLRDQSDRVWLSSHVGEPFMDLLQNWPAVDDIPLLLNMRRDMYVIGGPAADRLIAKLVDYLRDTFLQRGSVDEQTRSMMGALMAVWRQKPDTTCYVTLSRTTPATVDTGHLEVAVMLADGEGKFRIDCISHLNLLTYDEVSTILHILQEWSKPGNSQDIACYDLAQFLAYCGSSYADNIVALWRPVLYRMVKQRGEALVECALHNWSTPQYITFLCNLQQIFRGKAVWNPRLSPPILKPSLHQWAVRLRAHMPVILRLQGKKGGVLALRCLKAGSDPWLLEGILCHLGLEDCWLNETALYELSYGIACLLLPGSENCQDVYEVLCSVFQMSLGAAGACARLLDLCRNGQADLASMLLSAWLQDPSWSEYDQMGFRDTGRLLQIARDGIAEVSTGTLDSIASYMDARYAELLAEAQRLDMTRIALKSKDSEAVSQLLYDNNIEDTTSMEDCFANLPLELLNVVENVDFSEVEILFPLSGITPLQRVAMGIGMAQSLMLRLYVGDYGSQPRFCIHLDDEPKLDSHNIHSQWVVALDSKPPELPICHGKITPATYQLARILSRYLAPGFRDILSIHTLVSKSLKEMGHECIVCGTLHGAILRRATICNSWICGNIFSRSLTEIKLANIREDPLAVDMLLATIKSAISGGHHGILPDCPFNEATCLSILRTLPAMERLATSKQLWATMSSWHNGKSEEFLTWAVCSFGGFLSSATGNLRIPSLPPGTLQFVLANASPAKELAFGKEFTANGQHSRVMFHGTSLDRLYLIMHQGLRNMSGTALQAYGAVRGPGIYLADDPSVAWGYADPRLAKSSNWNKSAIKMGRIILACELTAPVNVSSAGIYVTENEASVMVRYVFVVPSATDRLPITNHLEPPLMSVFKSLRSGAL